MAIFSRRILQKCIDENSRFLNRNPLKQHVTKLNQADPSDLWVEWEIVLLNALSKLGTVEHERITPGGKKPDIGFISETTRVRFMADIVTVSDQGRHAKNPVEELWDRLMSITGGRGLRGNSFYLETGQQKRRSTHGPTNLKLPKVSDFDKVIFNEQFYEFIKEIERKPKTSAEFVLKGTIDLAIYYRPGQEFAGIMHPSYTHANSLTQNRVYVSLLDKATQLRRAQVKLPLGIFVCDGGCDLLRNQASRVVGYFLQTYSDISFVVTVYVQEPDTIVMEVYEGKNFDPELRSCIEEIEDELPKPRRSAQNAINYLSGKQYPKFDFWGGWEIGERKVKISSRLLLRLLAGEITQEQLFEAINLSPSANFFTTMLREGRFIDEISIERTLDDDDHLTFTFGEPDPALCDFTVPDEE